MKLKGLTKLILAGTALAATAATLTTSTYAWYVTNSTVTVSGIDGTTASAKTSDNLLVAQYIATPTTAGVYNGAYMAKLDSVDAKRIDPLKPQTYITDTRTTTYVSATGKYVAGTTYYNSSAGTQTVDTSSFEVGVTDVSSYFVASQSQSFSKDSWGSKTWKNNLGNELVSTTYVAATGKYVAGTTYYTTNEGTATVDTSSFEDGVTDVSSYFVAQTSGTETLITFKYWLKGASTNGNSLTVYPTLTVTNTTAQADLEKQRAYSATAGVSMGDEFFVDAVYALRMTITKAVYSGTGADRVVGAEEVVAENLSVSDFAYSYTSALSGIEGYSNSSLEANTYYKSILNEAAYGTVLATGSSTRPATDPYAAATYITAASNDSFTIANDTDTLFTFTIWLEGTDAACYDSCGNQSFSFDFEFKTTV